MGISSSRIIQASATPLRKGLLIALLLDMQVDCWLERVGGETGRTWKADVFLVSKGRQIAIEIQHSYQTLADYQLRQTRYKQAGVEAYWLFYPDEYTTLVNSMAKWRLKHEFHGAWPAGGLHACIADFPVAYLEIEPTPTVRGARFLELRVRDWLRAVLDARFRWRDGAWECLEASPVSRT
jgi:hypothetical protein